MIHKVSFSAKNEENNCLIFLVIHDCATAFLLMFIIGNYNQEIQLPLLYKNFQVPGLSSNHLCFSEMFCWNCSRKKLILEYWKKKENQIPSALFISQGRISTKMFEGEQGLKKCQPPWLVDEENFRFWIV